MKENHLQIYENLENNICIFCYSNYILKHEENEYQYGYHSIEKVLFCKNCKNIYGCNYECKCNLDIEIIDNIPKTTKCELSEINYFWINTKKYILSDKPSTDKLYLLEKKKDIIYDKSNFKTILKNVLFFEDIAELNHFEIDLFNLDKLNHKINVILTFK